MTRSIFDPGGGETERSGSTFGAEDAANRSHIPRDIVDGEVTDEQRAGAEPEAGIEAAGNGVQAHGRASDETAAETPGNSPDAAPCDDERP